MNKTLDLDTFGEIMDEFIRKAHIQLLIDIPEGTQEATVQGPGLGSVVNFYILLNAIGPVFKGMLEDARGGFDQEKLADAICGLVKDELMEVEYVPEKETGDAEAE